MISELSNVTSDLVKAILDASVQRHKVITNNIANHNTPGFVPQKLDFESLLNSALSETGALQNDSKVELALDFIEPETTERSDSINTELSEKALDLEMAELAKNTLRYEALIRGLGKLSSIRGMAISGGKN